MQKANDKNLNPQMDLNAFPGLDLNSVGLSFEQLDANPRFQGVSGCSGCLSDNTNATAQRPSACMSCG